MDSKRLLPTAVVAVLLAATSCGSRPTYAGALEGMIGTTGTEVVNEAFHARLSGTEAGRAGLVDTDFAAETYDSVVIVALAAEVAGTDGTALAKEITGVTRDGTECESVAACLAVIREGGDPSYVGATGRRPLNEAGEPDTGNYQVETFGANDRIDPTKRTFRKGSRPDTMTVTSQPITANLQGDGVLRIGALQPKTGRAKIYLPAVSAGWELALADIKAAGGVLGQPLEHRTADAGDASDDTGVRGARALLADGVDVVIAANSSAVTLQVIDEIVNAGIPIFSPLNTAPVLTNYADHGLYFRNLPSDLIQADTLAHVIAERGNRTVSIVALDDVYGNGLAEQLAKSFETLGVTLLTTDLYGGATSDFFPIARRVAAADPDAIVLVSFSEASRALRAFVVSGIGPRRKQIFGTDGTTNNTIGELFDAGR